MTAESLSTPSSVDPAFLSARFREMFETKPRLYRAPGRVNLIGEHTDYNDGFVMPVALDLSCWIAAAPRRGRTIVVHSINADQTVSIQPEAAPGRTGGWLDYVAGVIAML